MARTSCTDPIPTCGRVCSKPLNGCDHFCQQSCHSGPCPPCSTSITQVCSCGNDRRTVTCSAAQSDGEAFKCNRICRALRHCSRHPCGQKCCPLAFQEALLSKKSRSRTGGLTNILDTLAVQDVDGTHVCPLICGRLLSCGLHRCERNDHRGPCGQCLASNFSEVTCHCGGTVLMPPVPCGTKLECHLPCARAGPPCGHPVSPHTCHADDVECPPCTFLTTRPCQCEKHLPVKNVRCSADKVSCGQICNESVNSPKAGTSY